jgi:hypothetical protein
VELVRRLSPSSLKVDVQRVIDDRGMFGQTGDPRHLGYEKIL